MPLTRQSARATSVDDITHGESNRNDVLLPQVTQSMPVVNFHESHRSLNVSEAFYEGSSRSSGNFLNKEEELRSIKLEELDIELRELEIRKQKLMVRRKAVAENEAVPDAVATKLDPNSRLRITHFPAADTSPDRFTDQGQPTLATEETTTKFRDIDSVLSTITLPKIEIDKYDGNPMKFCQFMKSFKMFVADKVVNDDQRLMYLIHHCRGAAKDAIEHCVLLPRDEGYIKAMEILRTQFGRPHAIAETFLGELLDGENIQTDDVESLRNLIRQMVSCETALAQVNLTADLNCSTNLKRIVQRLPRHLQLRWAEVADDILHTSAEPTFRHLVEFLEKRLSVATNCYGQVSGGRGRPTNRKSGVSHQRINATIQQRPAPCPACSDSHDLVSCPLFRSKGYAEKLEIVKRYKLCFNCLKPNHRAVDCRFPSGCGENGCRRRHHKLIHLPSPGEVAPQPEARVNSTYAETPTSYLGFVPIKLTGPKGHLLTYAFLDNGSDSTLLLREVAEQVGLEGAPTKLQVSSINGTLTNRSSIVSFDVESVDTDYRLRIDEAYTVDMLPIVKARIPPSDQLKRWPHLQGVRFPQMACDRVGLLIGTNVPEAHWVLDQRIGTSRQPYASLTVLGWVLFGPACDRSCAATTVCCLEATESIESKLLEMFELEFNERKECDEKAMSIDDKRVLDRAYQLTVLKDGHYQVPLPWKMDWRSIPENIYAVRKRLGYLRKRFLKEHDFLRCYNDIITSYEAKGYVSKVSGESLSDRRFIPHHPVVHPHKPGKVRIVFDCAFKMQGISLNDCLYSGPDMSNDLTGVLLRFRLQPIGLSADIEEMFLQVRLPPEDSRPLSFLWYPKGDLNMEPQVYQWNVHPFGATSSPFCATFALRRTAIDNRDSFDDQALIAIRENFYVDDCLVSVESVPEAVRLADQLRRLTAAGGFRLHKWVSNSDAVLSSIPHSERSLESIRIGKGDSCIQRVLGMRWCVKTDTFLFEVNLPDRPATKRGILSCTASLYDPLGYVAPLLLEPKKLIQQLCRLNCGWDEPVSETIRLQWQNWRNVAPKIESLNLRRCLKPPEFDIIGSSLHLFSDASEVGYGAVAYLRYESSSRRAICSFVLGKSRVAPLKAVTIPRLELQAAVLSVRIMNYVIKEMKLKPDKTYFWTDSTIVLNYIANTKSRFKTFVANRISFIRDYTHLSQWRYVPTLENPADLASRGVKAKEFERMDLWLNGPGFLMNDDDQWPPTDPNILVENLPHLETRQKATVMSTDVTVQPMDVILTYFSSWTKLLRTIAWLRRFKTFMRRSGTQVGPLKIHELREAERDILIYIQKQAFGDVTKCTKQNDTSDDMSPSTIQPALRKLCPIVVDNLLCVGGRLKNSKLLHLTRHPIILPCRCPVIEVIIRHYHETEGHMGVAYMLALLRRKYWIMKGAAAVKRVIHKCIGCRIRSARPVEQLMSDLPTARVVPDFPFATTGVDYFGPFLVREGRSTRKRYGCLFTCMKTRAVHIEVSYALTIDSFLMTFSRFINRRGSPREMYSDRGTNFVGAEWELRQFLRTINCDRIEREMTRHHIEWHFNPPYSSHRGGVWERLVRCIRRLLSAVSREQTLTDESLTTALTEVERILNSRPLVPVYDDPQQLDVLTPNHILLLREPADHAETHVNLRERYSRHWRQGQLLADTFWRRWTREYLPLLQYRSKWNKVRRNLQVGDLVLIIGEPQARNEWPKGIVISTTPGTNGLVRKVSIKTCKGIIDRDIRKVCLLEGVED